MIAGIGGDLVDARRIERVLARFGDRFLERCFTAHEQAVARGRRDPALFLAKRFAAKEAAAKALGSGIAHGMMFRDIGVENDANGRPRLVLTGETARRAEGLALHVTLSDEPPYAMAVVVAERF